MESFDDVKYILNGFLFIFSGVLVMWMAAGFALLEAGLTRGKNTGTILTKNVVLFSLSCVVYYFLGYSLMYKDGGAFLGSFALGDLTGGSDFPKASDFFFQVMFVATAASVISGSVAERMKMLPFFLFVIALSGFIYPIQGHWTWGGGLTQKGGLLEGFSDFAGSTIVHSVGGWAALAGVLLLGAREGKYRKNGKIKVIMGSNLSLATLGTFILWMGWFGFNGGSVLAMGTKENIDLIALVVASTNMGATAGALSACILSYIIYKKIDLTFVLNGALAGLVSVTAGPDLGMNIAFIEGAIGGAIVIFAVSFFDRLRIDDPVGALSVHLVGGIWGTLAVGIFGNSTFVTQLKGVVVIGLFVFLSSFVVWYILKKTMGIRVSKEEEFDGLDQHEIGLEAYPEFVKTTK